jgi:lysozyme
MTSPYLVSDLKLDEGFRSHAYPDPLSGAEPWTVGYGATGPDIGPNTVWTEPEAATDLAQRVGALTGQLQSNLHWFRSITDLRQDVLVNMSYNMGLHGLLAFHNTLSMIEAGNYAGAAQGMLDSAWARQVHGRASRLAAQMQTGVHA